MFQLVSSCPRVTITNNPSTSIDVLVLSSLVSCTTTLITYLYIVEAYNSTQTCNCIICNPR
ncbi:hypothetical protein BO85DRAFT_22278 [Aspergillus piperis CBS 112811]|uniref:Uncharacterized protein n=1 Tax=Aspergillus piperis CBS 112811 TaxID=1448313 RepID=A0A8G1VRR5_9EURO|nr:hypothetical protein BO85DRAFT_22278 [Aspergillus piperis CBS 112811]RAH63364.1 hypothetical protein BO85DRAFT_22278 [Aspergillus piperis CBS 112811]